MFVFAGHAGDSRSVLKVITSAEVRLWFSRRLFLWVLTSWYYYTWFPQE